MYRPYPPSETFFLLESSRDFNARGNPRLPRCEERFCLPSPRYRTSFLALVLFFSSSSPLPSFRTSSLLTFPLFFRSLSTPDATNCTLLMRSSCRLPVQLLSSEPSSRGRAEFSRTRPLAARRPALDRTSRALVRRPLPSLSAPLPPCLRLFASPTASSSALLPFITVIGSRVPLLIGGKVARNNWRTPICSPLPFVAIRCWLVPSNLRLAFRRRYKCICVLLFTNQP